MCAAMIKILFFAQLREQLSCESLSIESGALHTVADLRQYLVGEHPHWEQFLGNQKLLVAVNQIISKPDQVITNGDEVAFFPPVTGG